MIERPLSPEDLPAVHQVRLAVEVADALPLRTPLDEVEEELTGEAMTWESDTVGLFEDGECRGYAWVDQPTSPSAEGWSAAIGVAVHPDSSGAGLGRRLLDRVEARGQEWLVARPDDLPLSLDAYIHDTQVRAARVLALRGYMIIRYFDELTVDLSDLVAVPPVPGVDLITWDDARVEEARVLKNDAFADHWAASPTSATRWARHIAPPRFQPALSTMALVDGVLAGFVTCRLYPEDWESVNRQEVYIALIGVHRNHRGRGVASAMIARTLSAAAATGLTHATLGVDTANPTGAYGLYTSLGFATTARTQRWSKPISRR